MSAPDIDTMRSYAESTRPAFLRAFAHTDQTREATVALAELAEAAVMGFVTSLRDDLTKRAAEADDPVTRDIMLAMSKSFGAAITAAQVPQ